MVNVLSVCDSVGEASAWPIVFVTVFGSFLVVDVGLTAFALFRSVDQGVR